MANKETRVFKSNTFEEFRQKSNEVSLHLGDNEQLNASLSDKTFNYNNVSAGETLFTGLDVLSKTQQFNIKTEQTLDNTGGYIILTGSPTITGFVADATLTQAGGYSATIVSASTDKILVKHSSGTFSSSANLVVGGNSIAASAVVRIIGEAFHIGVVRVYINGTEINQDMNAGGFHVPNYAANIPLLNSPTVTAFTEGSTVYQGSSLAAAVFSGTVLSASATELKLKNHTGSFSPTAVIKIDGSSSTITGANHGELGYIDTTIGNAIVLNTPATLNDDIKVYSPSLVDAVNELQDDMGIIENLEATLGTNVVTALNNIESVFDASAYGISAGVNAFDITSGTLTLDSSGDINLDVDGDSIHLKAGSSGQFGEFERTGTDLIIKSGNSIMVTGSGSDATFANDLTITSDLQVGVNLSVDGTTELNSTLGVDGNFRVGSSNSSKFDVAAATGNTQIDGTLEVDGTAGIDGDLRVGPNKFNVTASSGNTQIDGTLEVDGTAGVDGNFRVGSSGGDKFNVTAASGNTQIDGTLNVDSTTTLNGTTIDGNLDLNGSVDVSTNATIHGVLDVDGVSNLDVVDIDGAVDMALTLQVDGNTTIDGVLDIGQLNALFTNRNDVKLALNELHTEVGSAQIGLVSGLAAYGQSNMTNAINIIDAEIGTVASYEGGTYGSTTISGVLTNLQTGMINNDTDITNLFADVGSLVLVDNLPTDYTYTITDLTTATNTMSGFIGSTSIANIGTTDTVTGALQKLHAEIGDSNLAVFAATDISGALRELETEKVYLASSTQQEITSKLGITGDVTIKDGGSNANRMVFQTGTTLDVSNGSLLLPGNASNVNIFSASFLEVDGNVQTQGFSVDRAHVAILTDTSDVRVQWSESHADGSSASNPARSWQIVGLDDAASSHTTDIVTFYNAKELITNNTESGINVTWDSTNENFDFNVNDPTLTFTGDVTGSGTITNLGNLSVALTVQPNSVALTTDTTGDYVRTVTGTTNQITVSGSGTEGRAATFSIPTDFRAPGTVKILGTTASGSTSTGALTVAGGVGIGEDLYVAGNLYVEGDRVELNVSTLEVEDSIIVTNSLNASVGQFGVAVNDSSGNIDHSLYYNYSQNQWEADGVRILDDVNSILTPQVKTNSGTGSGNLVVTDITGARDLNFIDGTGIDVRGSLSGTDINLTITNSDLGSSQTIFKNFTAGSGGTATANINNDTLNLLGGTALGSVRSGDTITFNHDDVGQGAQTHGQSGSEDGTYIKSVTVNAQGHVTGVTSDDFDDRYNNYVLPLATNSIRGGVKIGYTESGKNYPVELLSEQMYVNVPWTDTTYSISCVDGAATDEERIRLTAGGSGSGTDDVILKASTGLTIARSSDTITYTNSAPNVTTNISITQTADTDTVTVNSSDGTDGTIIAANSTNGTDGKAGIMTRAMIHKLNGIATGATNTAAPYYTSAIGVGAGGLTQQNFTTTLKDKLDGIAESANNSTNNVTTNISVVETANTDTVTVQSSDGTDDTIGIANSTTGSDGHAGIMSRAMVHKLNGIATGATNTAAPHYTSAIAVGDGGLTTKNFTTTLKDKLDGIASGATNTVGNATHTGDVTGSGALTIAANAVSNAKLADMAVNTIKGKITAAGDPQDLSAAQVRTLLNVADGATAYSHFNLKAPSSASAGQAVGNGATLIITGGSGITTSRAGTIINIVNDAPNVTTNLSTSTATTSVTVNSSDGTNATIGEATGSAAGVMSTTHHNKLDGITSGANVVATYPSIAAALNQHLRVADNVHFEGLMIGQGTGSTANTIRCTGDVVSYYSSDERLKDNITPIENSLEKVGQLKGYEFDWNNNQEVYEGHDVGVIAQEVEKVVPEIVTTREHDGYKAVKYEKLVPLLINAINELAEENKLIRSELENLKSINT